MFVFDPVFRNRHGFGCWAFVGLIMFWACMLSTLGLTMVLGYMVVGSGQYLGLPVYQTLLCFPFFSFLLCFMGLLDDSRLHGQRSSMNRKLRWEQLGW